MTTETRGTEAGGNDWKSEYASLICSAEQAVSRVQPGQRVFVGTGCAQPQALVRALADRKDELEHVQLNHVLLVGEGAHQFADKIGGCSFKQWSNIERELIQKKTSLPTPIPEAVRDKVEAFVQTHLPKD